jgi:hypothetical protein
MTSRWARVARGVAAALFAVFVAGFAHVAGGGSLPGVAGLSIALAFSVLACVALAGRTVSTARLSLAVVLSQGVFHVLFLMSGATSSRILPQAVTGPGMHMSMSAHIGSAPQDLATTGSAGMWFVHAVAAGVTVVALRWGEAAFWAIVAAARLLLERAVQAPRIPMGARASSVIVSRYADRRAAPFLSSGLRHRGPPRLLFAPA